MERASIVDAYDAAFKAQDARMRKSRRHALEKLSLKETPWANTAFGIAVFPREKPWSGTNASRN